MTSEKTVFKKRALREELIVAGLDFLNANRVEELTMRKLASLCHVTPHAIYNHFANKDALIEALSDRVLQDLTVIATEIVLQSSLNFEGKMIALTNAYLKFIEKYPFHWQVAQKSRSSTTPSYVVDMRDGALLCKNKYPGFPTLKTLNRFSKLPAPIIDAVMKKQDLSDRIFSMSPSVLEPMEDKAETCLGQITLYSFVTGLSFALANGSMSSAVNRKQAIQEVVRYLFKRYF